MAERLSLNYYILLLREENFQGVSFGFQDVSVKENLTAPEAQIFLLIEVQRF